MQLAMIGLGRMGGNMVRRLLKDGHELVVYDRSSDAVRELVGLGALGAKDLPDLRIRLAPPRVIWIMVPAGAPVDETLDQLTPLLSAGDIVIDGGNSNFRDSIRRGEMLRTHGVELIDVGTSGGIWGLEVGYCLMVGGSKSAVTRCEPIFRTLAPEGGDHLRRKGVVLPGAKTGEQRKRDHRRWNIKVDRLLYRPPPFSRVLHETSDRR
jgi:6-phosphogluconate dehydrogenase